MKIRRWLVIVVSVLFMTFLSGDLLAKSSSSSGSSFSGGGGSRSSGSSFSGGGGSRSSSSSSSHSTPSRSSGSSFSGGGGSRSSDSYSSKSSSPSYDNSARSKASHDSSAEKFKEYNKSSSPSQSSSGYSISKSERMTTVERQYRPNEYYKPSRTTIIYRDNYSSNFLQFATMMWLFNHWDSVDKSRFSDEKLKQLEAKVKELESQGVKKDPNYVQPGVDKDLVYNEKESEGLGPFAIFLLAFLLGLIIFGGGTWAFIQWRKRR